MLEEILDKICPPALLYIFFTIVYTSIDLYNKKYTEAGVKLIIMIIMTVILNILCSRGLKLLAYLVVFLPLIFMFHLSALIYDMYTKNKNIDSDSDLTSYNSDVLTTTTSTNTYQEPGFVISGDIGYITNTFFNCKDFCKPEYDCTYECYKNNCYKKTDEPDKCWKKYKDTTTNIDIKDIPGARFEGKCPVNVTAKECSDYSYGYDFNYKGNISGGSKYPSQCFMLNGGNGSKNVFYNVDKNGRNCSNLDPCLCV